MPRVFLGVLTSFPRKALQRRAATLVAVLLTSATALHSSAASTPAPDTWPAVASDTGASTAGQAETFDLQRRLAAARSDRHRPPAVQPVKPERVAATPTTPTPKRVRPTPPRKAPPPRAVAPEPVVPPADGSRAAAVVAFALAQVGKPYARNAAGPGSYDCSGLIMRAFAQVGESLPHQTGALVREGRAVARADLQPGDLVFPSSGHVGIFVGSGRIVHSPKPGDHVKVSAIYTFRTARRVL